MGPKIYVVMDYDYVAYAGLTLSCAVKHVKGGGGVQVWQDGKLVAMVRYCRSSGGWVEKS